MSIFSWLLGHRSPTPCPYCPNKDRDSIFEHWNGCEYRQSGSGEDPPCVCDGYASNSQLDRLGMGR